MWGRAATYGAEHEPSDERGDESAAAQRCRQPVCERCGDRGQEPAPLRLLVVVVERRPPLHDGSGEAGDCAHQNAVADRLGDHAFCVGRGERASLGIRECQRDQERWDAEAVVEAALDIESLPDRHGQALVADNRLPERGIGRGQHDGEHHRLCQPEVRQHQHRSDRAGNHGQRQPNPEQARRHRVSVPQRAKIDARRIGEQHQSERYLREPAQRVGTRREIDPPQPLGPDNKAGSGEGDRRRQRLPTPGPQSDVGQHDPGDDGKGPPAHGSILPDAPHALAPQWR